MGKALYGVLLTLIALGACNSSAQQIILAKNNTSEYSIVIPPTPTKLEQRSASVLQEYILRSAGVKLLVIREVRGMNTPAIYIGQTSKAEKIAAGAEASEPPGRARWGEINRRCFRPGLAVDHFDM